MAVTTTTVSFPDAGWKDLSPVHGTPLPEDFNISHVINYFVTRSVCDSRSAADVKYISTYSNVVIVSDNYFLFKVKCLPEM